MQTKRCTNIKVLKSLIWSHKCSLWMSDKSHTMNCPSAWVGALAGRGDAISNEWKLETRAKLEAGDLKITAIIKVRRYILCRYRRSLH